MVRYRVFPSIIESNHRLTPSTRCIDVHAFEMMLDDVSHNNVLVDRTWLSTNSRALDSLHRNSRGLLIHPFDPLTAFLRPTFFINRPQ
jgi:hypothetical protein